MCPSNCISEDSMALSIEIIVFSFLLTHSSTSWCSQNAKESSAPLWEVRLDTQPKNLSVERNSFWRENPTASTAPNLQVSVECASFMPKVSFPYQQTAELLQRHNLQSKGAILKFPLQVFVEVNL